MAGHSKWKNIMHKKSKTDAQRAKEFTKIGKEIATAVREGGAIIENNARLRDAVAKAKAGNMPNDNIDRAIKRASGDANAGDYEHINYEGYGAGGIAVVVECLTDNRNRTAGEVRHAFDKQGGSLGTSGSVLYQFDHKGVLVIERDKASQNPDDMMMLALEAGAEDFEEDENLYEITTAVADFTEVRESLEKEKVPFASAELEWVPQNTIALDIETEEKLEKLIEHLEDLDDVQNVYHNGEFSEE